MESEKFLEELEKERKDKELQQRNKTHFQIRRMILLLPIILAVAMSIVNYNFPDKNFLILNVLTFCIVICGIGSSFFFAGHATCITLVDMLVYHKLVNYRTGHSLY